MKNYCMVFAATLFTGILCSSAFLITFIPSDQSPIDAQSRLEFSNSIFQSNEERKFDEDDDIETLAMKEIQEQKNKKLIQNFYKDIVVDRKFDIAYKYLSAETYIQHNPDLADGVEAIIGLFRKTTPLHLKTEIHHIGADGDLVYVHANVGMLPDGTNYTVVDIYRVQDQKIVEHWDVIQSYRMFANAHPFF